MLRYFGLSFFLVFLSTFVIFANSGETEEKEPLLVNAQDLPEYLSNHLKQLLSAAGERKAVISSKKRSVRKQVEVMLDYYITCDKIDNEKDKEGCGILLARSVYDKECHAAFDVYDPTQSRQKNINQMTKELTLSLIKLGENRVCMNHVEIPEIPTRLIAIDIKPSSITNHQKFYDVVKQDPSVVQFYYPAIKNRPRSEAKDAAFHLGFERQ